VIHVKTKAMQDHLVQEISKLTLSKLKEIKCFPKKALLPRIIVIGVEKSISPDIVLAKINESLSTKNEDITFVRRTKGNEMFSSIIFEVPNRLLENILSLKKIYVGWCACKIDMARMVKQ